MKEHCEYNIAARSVEERERVNIDLAASGVAYKERMNMPVLAIEVERQQPERYRELSSQFPSGNDAVYAKTDTDK